MRPRPPQPADLLRDLRREERWLGDIAAQGRGAPEATAGLDALLSELRAAFALRRRLQAQLATERELQELTGGVVVDRDGEELTLDDVEQLKAG